MIPTRVEIQNKINEIRQDPSFSTIKEDLISRVSEWLDNLGIEPVIRFGETIDPKAEILDDLGSYEGF